MPSKRFLHHIRLFALISISSFLAACGEGTGPTPVAGAPCPDNGVVSFDAESYPGNVASASVSLTDSCVGYKTVNLLVDNGTETITVAVTLDSRGSTDPVTIKFGPTDDVTDTIAIAEGNTLTAAYTDANSVRQTDTASIVESSLTLGVYSETNTDPVLNYSQITNAGDLGGFNTLTTEVAADVIAPLEGVQSLQAVFETDNPVGGTYNGFAFSFASSIGTGANDLVNPSFEIPDASAGDVDCVLDTEGGTSSTGIPGWKCFNGAFVASNLFKPGGPDDVQNPTAVDGTQILKIFNGDGLAQQSITVAAGDNVHASVYAMNWTGDEFNNLLLFQLAFFDAADAQVGVKEVFANTVGDQTYKLEPKDGGKATDWTLMELSDVAPAGAVRAQILILQVLTDGTPNTGSVSLDAPRLYAGDYDPAPPLADSADISTYDRLKFGINTTASTGLAELEVKMEDASAGSASVFLSAYTPTIAGDWAVYEVPLDDFGSILDKAQIISLGFYNASTVANTAAGYPALLAATLYFDDVHFVKKDTGPAPLTGVLLDSPVEGVTYSTETQSGITNADGEFSYFSGEMVTFSVGGILLGTIEGAAIITPVELTGGGNPVNQAAINQLIFLQSIDEDQDPSNGITISAATQAAAATQTLDFTLDSAAFTTAVTDVISAITPAPGNAIVSKTTALDNFYFTYTELGGTDIFDWSFPPQDYPAYPGLASFPVNFEDAGAPYFFSDFEGGVATVIENPDVIGNSSAKVAQMQKFAGQTYGGSTLTLGEISYANGTVFTMNVWASRAVPVTLKLEGPENVERVVSHTGSGAWEQLVFVFDGINADTGAGARAITLIFDNGVAGDAANDAANWTFYFDDINLVSTDPTKYKLIFADEFDGSALDTANWTIETGYGPADNQGWGNNEWQNYTADSVKVEGGNLVITADCATAPDCGVRDGTVTSGRINTFGNFSFKYGIAEARIKAPVQKAAWPAFWMLGKNFPDVGWPFTGEVDIVELFAYESDDKTTHAAMHWCDETVDGVTSDSCFPVGWQLRTGERSFDESLGDDFHVFSAEWNEDRIIAKIDGIEYFNQVLDPVTMDEFLKEFFLILNVAVGGSLGSGNQDPDGTEVWPQTMLVDYVRVYQLIPASPADTTITTAETSVIADGTTTTITVQAKDDTGSNFTYGGADVTLAVSGNASISEVTDAGDGTYTATLSNLTAETVTVSGTIDGDAITSGDVTVSFIPGAASPADTTITPDTATLVAGTSVTITVAAFDVNGNPTPGANVILSADGSALVTPTPVSDNNDGTYTATLSNTTAETVTVTGTINDAAITSGGVQLQVPVTFIPGAASPADTTINASSSSAVAGTNVTITVAAFDVNGNPTPGANVVLSVGGAALLAPTPATDNNDGTYTSILSSALTESVVVTGTIDGSSITSGGVQVQVPVNFIPGSASPDDTTINVSSNSAVAGTDVTITVEAFDVNGNPTPNATVILSVDGSASVTPTPVFDNNDGTYTATLSNTTAETVTVTGTINSSAITSGGVQVQVPVTFTPGVASETKTFISVEPSVIKTGSATGAIVVRAVDQNDNFLTTGGDVVKLSATGGATIAGDGVVDIGGGLFIAKDVGNGTYTATISNMSDGTVTLNGTIQLANAGPDLPLTSTDVEFQSNPPSAADSTFVVSSTTAVAGGPGVTLTVQAFDDAGAAIITGGANVTFVFDGSASVTATNDPDTGTYTASLSNLKAEPVTVTAKINNVVINSAGVPVERTVTFTPGWADKDKTTISVSTNSETADGTTVDIIVQAVDANDNNLTVGGSGVKLSTTGGVIAGAVDNLDGTFTATDAGNGTYTATISSTTIQNVTISGSICTPGCISEVALASTQDVDFISLPPVGAETVFDVTTGSALADGSDAVTITVISKDINGIPLTTGGNEVLLTTTGDAIIGGPGVIANLDGSYTANDVGDGTYTATITNSTVQNVIITGKINTEDLGNSMAVDFTQLFSATETTMTASFASAAVKNGTNTGTVTTITVQAKNAAGENLTFDPGSLALVTDSPLVVGSVTQINGLYSVNIESTVAQEAVISGSIGGIPFDANVTVKFGNTLGVVSDNNIDLVYDVVETITEVDGTCETTTVTDLDDSGPQPPSEGSNLKQVDFIQGAGVCNGFVFNIGPAAGVNLPVYSTDFESPLLADMPANTNIEDFKIGNIVNDGAGWFPGTFGAPANYNNGYSRIVPGEGDAAQGEQQLSIFNDYNDFGPFVTQGPGTKVQAFVTRDVGTVGAGDDGATYRLSFDAKLGNLEAPWQAEAFVKVLKSSDGSFIELANNTFDSDASLTIDWAGGYIDLVIDAGMVGELVQLGFNSTSTDFGPTGIFYDNLDFSPRLYDLSGYEVLKFAIDSSLAPGLVDLEVRLVDSAGGTASVYLSNPLYTPTAANIGGASWNVYEIPVDAFVGVPFDNTSVQYLGFHNASTEIFGHVDYPALFDATLYVDDIHFIETPPPPAP